MGYEFFVVQHIISAVAYLIFVYLHTRDLFTSWIYLWATIGIYGAAIVIRVLASAWWTVKTEKAVIKMLPDSAVSVRIKAPVRKGQWTAGQHAFIRFLAISPYQTHPFTIASIEEDGEVNFIIKRKAGMTGALYNKVKKRMTPWTTRVIIDGPYGGPGRDPGAFDTVILVAGGVGVTFCLPVMKDLVKRMQNQAKIRCSKIIFVWSVPSENTLEWILPEVEDCVAAEKCLQVEFYVTRPSHKADFSEIVGPQISVDTTRPQPDKIILEEAEHEGKICVMGAGPDEMMATLRRTVGDFQMKVIKGGGSGEIFLYIEPFGW
jgi:ferredoxin-NADP reductase